MNQEIDDFFQFLAEGYQSEDSYFSKAYNSVYDFITLNPIEQSLNYIFDRIHFLFQNLISQTLSDDSIDHYNQIVRISQKFKENKIRIRTLFSIIEKFSKLSLTEKTDMTFISLLRSSVNFDFLCSTFLEAYNSFHFISNIDMAGFSDLILVSKLIHFTYYDKKDELFQRLIEHTSETSEQFLNQIEIKDISEYITNLIQYLDVEQTLLFNLFSLPFATKAFQVSYNIITSSNQKVNEIKQELKKSCQIRNYSFVLDYYHLITFYEPSNEKLTFFSDSICEQITNESPLLNDLQQSIPFYNELYNKLNNIVLTKKYDRCIAELLNKNNKNIMKALFSSISKIAQGISCDIFHLLPIISRIENKNEFELLYAYHITKRIVPPTEKQIEKEKNILNQIKSSSSSYDFSNVFKLLHEAKTSIERHIGPVFICHSTLWPFRPPFPKCDAFTSICQEITEKYRKFFPNRILTFPFDSWVVSIKNTQRNYFLSGNAVQAQVLLHFNKHSSINQDSLSPLIMDYQLKPVLNSLSSDKLPILLKQENLNIVEYILNDKFRHKQPLTKLPSCAFAKKSAPKDVTKAKNEQMNATIMHIMKEKRIMKYSELESSIIEKMSDRYYVTPDEFRIRINDLKAREFIQNAEDPSFLVYVP